MKLHIQLDANVTYSKERNNEFYTAKMVIISAKKDGVFSMQRNIFCFDGKCLDVINEQILKQWEECFCELQNNYSDLTFGSPSVKFKSYRNNRVVDYISTFNLITRK